MQALSISNIRLDQSYVEPPYDIHWDKVVIAMKMNGSSGNTDFVELVGRSFTRYGQVYEDTSQKKFGTASAYFDGIGDNFQFADAAAFDTPADFTTDCWIRLDSIAIAADRTVWQIQGTEWKLIVMGTAVGADANKIAFSDGSIDRIISSSALSANTWYYVLVQRRLGVVELFLAGTSQGTWSNSSSLTPTGFNIGSVDNGSEYFQGFIDDFRHTVGVARVSGSFTPPTTEFRTNDYDKYFGSVVLRMTMNSLTDFSQYGKSAGITGASISTLDKKYGTASLLCDGLSDYLSFSDSADWDMGGVDYSIELWVKKTGNSNGGSISSLVVKRSAANEWHLIISDANGSLEFAAWDTGGTPWFAYSGSLTWDSGTWYFVQMIKTGTSLKLYRDTIEVASGTYPASPNQQSSSLEIGGTSTFSGVRCLNGRIDDLRITKSVARPATVPSKEMAIA